MTSTTSKHHFQWLKSLTELCDSLWHEQSPCMEYNLLLNFTRELHFSSNKNSQERQQSNSVQSTKSQTIYQIHTGFILGAFHIVFKYFIIFDYYLIKFSVQVVQSFKTKQTEASHWWCLHRNVVASTKIPDMTLTKADSSDLLQTLPIPMCCFILKTFWLQSFQMRKTSAHADASSSSIKLLLTPGVPGLMEKTC